MIYVGFGVGVRSQRDEFARSQGEFPEPRLAGQGHIGWKRIANGHGRIEARGAPARWQVPLPERSRPRSLQGTRIRKTSIRCITLTQYLQASSKGEQVGRVERALWITRPAYLTSR